MDTLRLLLVEDQTVVREGLRQLVESEPGLAVAGEAGTVAAAISLAGRVRPDVVLLDLKLPDGNGLDAARAMLAAAEPPAVLVLSTFEDVALVRSALALGCSGYIPKSASFAEIVSAVRAVATGTVVLHPSLAAKVAQKGAEAELTESERAMLKLLAAGASYGEMGATLYMSERTVRRHMNALFGKMGVSTPAQAAAEGLRRGLVE
jgi:DNA-binding NarL/FixJ family response regulator